MITNVLDCRGDHSAIDPVDAMIVSYALEADGRGVSLARTNIREGIVREDISVTDALAWAQELPRGVVLILLDGSRMRSELAEERSSEPGANRRRLLELGIRIPLDGMRFEREQDMLTVLSEVLVPPRKVHRRRSRRRARGAR